MEVELTHSNRKDKRYEVRINGKKSIHFGSKNGQTFIDHGDIKKKDAWLARHRVNENWSDPMTAGYWSRWLLWNKRDIQRSMELLERRKEFKFV